MTDTARTGAQRRCALVRIGRAEGCPAGGRRCALARARRLGFLDSRRGEECSRRDAGDREPARVFKTLLAEVDGRLVVGIFPVDRQLDLKALAAAMGGKRAVMVDAAAAERATGYVVGGISPLGQKRAHPTVLDASAHDHPTILVSGGKRGLDLELAPADLQKVTRAGLAAIAR